MSRRLKSLSFVLESADTMDVEVTVDDHGLWLSQGDDSVLLDQAMLEDFSKALLEVVDLRAKA